jgi:outer membrane protein OmpA-like peptidoglycan-associated protein
MTYIICIIAMAALSVVALYVARRYGMGQADERASDDVLRKLYGQYWAQVSAITQTYLLKAPSDEEWLAEIKTRVSASDAEVPSRSLWSWLTDHFHDDGASVRQTAAAQLGLEALGAAFRGPLSRIVRMQEKTALIPHRVASGKPKGGRRSVRRTSRSNRRFGSGRLTGEVALAAAVTVMAIVVAVAVTAFGLRFWIGSSLTSASSPGTSVVIAATATANEPAPALPLDIVQELRSAGGSSAGATAYILAPGTSQPDTISLTPRSADGQVDNGPTRTAALDTKIAAVERALANEANPGQLDVLAALATAARTASRPATLILVSSGLSTSGGFDLRQVGWDANPSSLATQLKASGHLPDLAGIQVVFVGLGDTAGRQPALPLPQQATLAAYWTAICRAAGAAACTIDNTARPQLASHVKSTAPVVPVPVVAMAAGPASATITTLPAALLFRFNSTVLIPYADMVLQPIVQQARSHHLLVSITGYASPDGGSSAYNLTLSAQRAAAVRAQLIALGLSAGQITQAIGAGTGGKSLAACMVDGHLDEAICAQLRRVVIVLSPARR